MLIENKTTAHTGAIIPQPSFKYSLIFRMDISGRRSLSSSNFLSKFRAKSI
jgi:hypothetical protein